MSDLSDRTTIVVGASRGLGRAITTALSDAGAPVVAVARDGAALATLAGSVGQVTAEVADAADADLPRTLLDRHDPSAVVLVAGAVPTMVPLQEQTWETFSSTWDTDVRITFHWLREILRRPMRAGGRVVVISSGAALAGSPLSGGYAGAKATQRFITGYAQGEAARAGLDVTFTAVMPRITPMTDVGRTAAEAYAAQGGQSVEEYLKQMGPPLTPQIAGDAVVDIVRSEASAVAPGYLLTGAGLKPLT